MNCPDVRELLDAYSAGELPDAQAREVERHLAECGDCQAAAVRLQVLVGRLRSLGEAFEPVEHFESALEAADAPDVAPVQAGAPEASVPSGRRMPLARGLWRWRVATAAAAVLALGSMSALAVPAIARQLPVPLVQEIDALEAQNADLRQQVDELTIRIEEIGGEDVPVIDTTPGDLPAEVNDAVQTLAMAFIRAQYAGDLDALAAMGTDRLREDLAEHPENYLRDPGAAVTFAQMTEAAVTEDGVYLLFVRLLDSAEWSESQYQEDFEIIKSGDTYLVDFMGMDA